MQNIYYFRTWQNGKQETHLSYNQDSGICGIDLAGDGLVHDRQPEKLDGLNHRITCDGCQSVVFAVRAHLTKRVPDLKLRTE